MITWALKTPLVWPLSAQTHRDKPGQACCCGYRVTHMHTPVQDMLTRKGLPSEWGDWIWKTSSVTASLHWAIWRGLGITGPNLATLCSSNLFTGHITHKKVSQLSLAKQRKGSEILLRRWFLSPRWIPVWSVLLASLAVQHRSQPITLARS